MPEKPILILDDDRDIREMLAELLTDQGYAVLQAANVEQAMDALNSVSIRAFLVDFQMPGQSGVDFCRAVRKRKEYRMAPILVITGSLDPATALQTFAAGGDDFVNKPIDMAVLLARLRAHLQRLQYFEELDRTRRMLHRYLSTRTRDIAETSTITGRLAEPEQRDVVILFTDIRGFTALAEQMSPNELFHLVSSHLADQVNLVYDHGGYIDKFGGDGVMAVFDGVDKAQQACLCALDMIDRAQATTKDGGVRELGIGIHTGMAMIGNIGSREHMDYSVIGTTVNLAARLCGHAGLMSIVVSEAVEKAAGKDSRLQFQSPRHVPIRGLTEKVTVYTLTRSPA